ncbi:hypothetical protein E2C01_092302 [Portunus trituberculatus]|uniref:Uncharacterized protein n=1 Tax=Portunus trituberculatus TaxID=210409 RepID=A0A5B7JXE0_PORTR|nr:hypothetical protein [Portunus trituberculatus]
MDDVITPIPPRWARSDDCWQTAHEAREEQELDPKFFNNVRANSCREMASMNAWRDGNEVAMRLRVTPPLQVVLLSYICIYAHKTTFLLALYNLASKKGLFCNA